MASYLVDTSVWIDFLRGQDTPHVRFLEGLLEDGEAGLCEVTYAEICFGAQNENQLKKYTEYFGALPFFMLPAGWHHQAARMGFGIRKNGFKPFMADLLVVLACLANKAILLTRDKDFIPYTRLFGLKIEPSLNE